MWWGKFLFTLVIVTLGTFCCGFMGSWDSLLVEWQNFDRKVVSPSPGKSGGRIILSDVNFVC